MGVVNLQNATLDTYSAATLSVDYDDQSSSATLFVNPADIFLAQISLSLVHTLLPATGASAYISSIMLQNGDVFEFVDQPNHLEWAWVQSVTFVLTNTALGSNAKALATITTYKL
jgi:hypothetical protein